MKRTNQLIFILIVLIIALSGAIYFRAQETLQATVTPTETQESIQQPIKKPIIHYPVSQQTINNSAELSQQENSVESEQSEHTSETEQANSTREQPNLYQNIELSLSELLKGSNTSQLFLKDNFIQRFVATVDHLPEKKLPQNALPLLPPKGEFIVSGTPEEPQTSTRNFQRYAPYIKVLKTIDPDLAVSVYTHFYSHFQKAYEQLGYKNAYFNDRLVFVIDHLLATPNPPDPLSLVQPVLFYTYANPEYENMSSGRKLLLRIGHQNRSTVLEILQQYRDLITKRHL